MDHLASSKAASNFTTISFPDIPKDACVVQICTIPDEYLNNPFFRLFLAGFHAFHHYLSSLVVSEDLVQLSASDPQDHTDLVYGNKDVTGECSGTLVYKNPQELITVFLGKIIEMSNKVQSRREAGGTSSLIIIICGPTSLHQGIIRELSHPLTASTTLSLLTLDEIKGYIKCTKGATIITQSMLCNGWVIRPSLGALPTPGAINSGIIGTRLCRRIARNVSPLIQHLPLHEFLTSDAAAASSSPAKLNNDESLSAAKQEVHEAISESCNGFLSIPTKRPLFNLYEALDDWSRLCGERRGASMPRLWERWQLLPHARAENNQASTGLGSCLELKKTQARILALLEPNIFGEQLICQLFELDANSTWSSMNDKLDRVIQKSVHHLAMINFASLLVTFEGLPSAGQAKPIVLTETNLSITLNDGERAFVNGIANYSLNSLLRNQNYRDEIIRSHLTYVCFISVVTIDFLCQEFATTPTVARQISKVAAILGYSGDLEASCLADIVDGSGSELSRDGVETRVIYQDSQAWNSTEWHSGLRHHATPLYNISTSPRYKAGVEKAERDVPTYFFPVYQPCMVCFRSAKKPSAHC